MHYYYRLLAYLKPYLHIVIFTWVISILLIALQGISVWILADFIEKLVAGEKVISFATESNFLINIMDFVTDKILYKDDPFKSLISGTIVLFITGISASLLRVTKLMTLGYINQSIIKTIRKEMFKHLTKLDLSFSKKYRPGEISFLFTKDVASLNFALLDATDRIVMQPLKLLMAITLMFALSVKLTFVILGFLMIGAVLVYYKGHRVEKLWKIFIEKDAHLQGYLTEYLSSIILAKSLGKEKFERRRFSTLTENLKKISLKRMFTDAIAPQIMTFFSVVIGCSLIIYGGYHVFVTKSMDGSLLIKIALLMPVATKPMKALASLYTSIRGSLVSIKRIFKLLDEPITEIRNPNAIIPKTFSKNIEIKNLNYNVSNIKILKNITTKFKHGTKTVIYGPSGAGKTTLLGLLAGFIQPTKGEILIDGQDINNLDIHSWRKQLGIVTQESILLNGTVRDNLLYAKPDATDKELTKALKQSLLWTDKCIFTNGLDTEVGNRGDIISGGERQRISIARCLLNDPKILLMDEPTSMLDYDSKILIRDTINSISKGRTIIIVAHDRLLFDIADNKIEIKNGKLS